MKNCRKFAIAMFLGAFAAGSIDSEVMAQAIVVMPYVQPGDGGMAVNRDTRAIHWWTEPKPGAFAVEYTLPDGTKRSVNPTHISLEFPALNLPKALEKPAAVAPKAAPDKAGTDEPKSDGKKSDDDPGDINEVKIPLPPETAQHYWKYTARLADLPLNSKIRYEVTLAGKRVREAECSTRATSERSIRCVVVGDLAQGLVQQKEIAFQISKQNPEFLVALGDMVYPSGRLNQYVNHFWDTYSNVAEPGPKAGAPLMATTPFYPIMGNHDVLAKMSKYPDAYAIYYAFSPPKNGPGAGAWATPIDGDAAAQTRFRAATADSYPYLDVYSFDQGPAHFVVFNSNAKINLRAPEFRKWLLDDLKASKAPWKFASFHIPAFQSSKQHYTEQQVRALQPLFEEGGVDVAFAGHIHNYQRSVPLTFRPDDPAKYRGLINGKFQLDTDFDGVVKTKPKGVIHIVAGGGGAGLYGPGFEKSSAILRKSYGANYANFTAKMVADQHSFVVLEISPTRLVLRALNLSGAELDHIAITK